MADDKSASESVIVRLDSATSEVDALAVADSMSAMVALIQEATAGIAEHQQLLVKARPFNPGSFEIPLELIAVAAAGLFAESPLINQVLDTLSKYFDVKKALKGEPAPKEATASVVVQGENVVVGDVVINMIQPSSPGSQELDRAVRTLERDSSIRAIEVLRGDNRIRIARIERDELEICRIPEPSSVEEIERTRKKREKLHIVSTVFEGRGKWTFNRDGHKVSISIKDEAFMSRVSSGLEVFSAGDMLDVDLEISQEFDKSTNSYLDKTYSITRVWKHIRRAEQKMLLD